MARQRDGRVLRAVRSGQSCMDPDHGNRIYRGDENTQKNLDLGGGQAYL